MFKLIELEVRKFKMKRYIKRVIICEIVIAAIMLMSVFTQAKAENSFVDISEGLRKISENIFLIFSAVILTKIVIGEYRNKTIMNMFMYPISRKKILATKLIIVWIFGFITNLVTYFCVGAFLLILNNFSDVFTTKVSANLIINTFGYNFMLGILYPSIVFIVLLFTTKEKSVSRAIVLAIVLSGIIDFKAFELPILDLKNFGIKLNLPLVTSSNWSFNLEVLRHATLAIIGVISACLFINETENEDLLN
ncbi:ABC transporter permease [Clostridium neuense]|uniref:ABC transporter permease n=1 Tax=Clostridium neuense TaxID=1728934 RepID=A0ABW8TAM8_9CLOT